MSWKGLLSHYQSLLPVTEDTPKLTLLEGNTPLLPLQKLSKEYGIDAYVKIEGANPTGSFKDRGMVMAMAKAVEEGAEAVICASTGNTSAAAAAYAARAGLRCIIVIPDGKIAQGKLAQAVMYGAEVYAIEGNFDEALKIVKHLAETDNYTLVNSINPYRMEGQKTAAFEVCDVLGKAPDHLLIPVGNAGNITAYWKGFKEYHNAYKTGLPNMRGFEASGSAAIVRGEIIEQPETLATAIRIGNPASWNQALDASGTSGGAIGEVTDEEIVEAYQWLAENEGVFAEPASCASIAGLFKSLKQGDVQKGSQVVCVLTGNGLKDPTTAIEKSAIQPTVLPNDLETVTNAIQNGVLS
ncbi:MULTISPECIES: threonine synthase [Pontibacillus]|uniref:Threonine synthase n=1 Tax=Pontibacillus chungwhensis TaxID=265426 RepID=A0ABY8V5C0_9BACI|nr:MULTISPECIES: threonine synthase [Pontibacillus]MCD5324664.1 threonine synthase [Pontibacillus sp. HN14]WIF99041.1 threonine synthase [Pontibacillus chungwhensis]